MDDGSAERIAALEAQVAELMEADRRPEHDIGEYYTFTRAELNARDAEVRRKERDSLVQAVDAAIRLVSPDHITPVGAQQIRAAMRGEETRRG